MIFFAEEGLQKMAKSSDAGNVAWKESSAGHPQNFLQGQITWIIIFQALNNGARDKERREKI